MSLLGAIQSTSSGLSAQRVRMDTVSANVANIDTTRAADGSGPYRRRIVSMSSADSTPFAAISQRMNGQASSGAVLTSVQTDTATPTKEVYDPSHPDANEDGYVEMPNIDLVAEMTDLTSANRSYQANVTVLNAVKQMALRALDIGSR
ncbi:flagellar basal-body rod protein FlgC [bacterium SCGC AG-212-C10]|nr:flagellar basal-body rod protein FlgC [bacterium SCGC AG-212-C10]